MNEPDPAEVAALRRGSTVIGRMAPSEHPELIEALRDRGVTGLCLDAVPRISRAQALDVLSTLSNIAGYRGVIEAAEAYGGMFAGQVTAAGKTLPAMVFVIGAGVAGLAAIGAAVSLGATVRAFDVRPEVAEQIESMGAAFVTSSGATQEVSTDGYARELTDDQAAQTARTYAAESVGADIVITTALVRGKAPTTITRPRWCGNEQGSVIVDLAASGGGNCELTEPGRMFVTDNGVTIIGYTDMAGRMPAHTSQLYGTNIVNLLKLLTPGKDGRLVLDLDDIVQRSITVTRDGEVLWPPPPVPVSALPAPTAAADRPAPAGQAPEELSGARHAPAAAPLRVGRTRRRGRRARDHVLAAELPRLLHGVRARGLRRILRDLQRQPLAAHPADGADQRDLRDHPGRRAAAAGRHGPRSSWCWWPPASPSINIFGGFGVGRMIGMFRKDG